MLDITFIRENLDIVRAALKNKNREGVDLDRLLQLADERKQVAGEITEINRKRNDAQATRDTDLGKRLKDELKVAEEKYQILEKEILPLLVTIPNIPSADTPVGPDESCNVGVREWGDPSISLGTGKSYDFTPKPHWEIG